MVDVTLQFLLKQSQPVLWLLFLVENIAITFLVLIGGKFLQQWFGEVDSKSYQYSASEIIICGVTTVLNTVVTCVGFWLCKHSVILFRTIPSFSIISDFFIMFFAMDLLMYMLHFIIHKTFLYKAIHQLHHQAINPKPIDLFVLHPIETLSFGGLWLIMLYMYSFNIYAVLIYLTVNVVFGLVGHLGIEPLPERVRSLPFVRYIGTSTFHHEHHRDVQHNYGFYTSIWDRLFGTLRRN